MTVCARSASGSTRFVDARASAFLATCGGDFDDTPTGPTTARLTTKVIDGAITNALVCFDVQRQRRSNGEVVVLRG